MPPAWDSIEAGTAASAVPLAADIWSTRPAASPNVRSSDSGGKFWKYSMRIACGPGASHAHPDWLMNEC